MNFLWLMFLLIAIVCPAFYVLFVIVEDEIELIRQGKWKKSWFEDV